MLHIYVFVVEYVAINRLNTGNDKVTISDRSPKGTKMKQYNNLFLS